MNEKSKFFQAFYKPRENNSLVPSVVISRNVDRVSSECLNDNEVIRIIYGVGNKLFGTDLDVTNNPNYPEEIKTILTSLQREIPALASAPDEETAFRYIRSRYAQTGGEIDSFIELLADDINQYRRQLNEQSNQAAESSQPAAVTTE